jgi:hypothetical protein
MNTTLTTLELDGTLNLLSVGNSINVDGARSLAGALKLNTTLQSLSLRGTEHVGFSSLDNSICTKGVQYIAEALVTNVGLKVLGL